MQGYLFGRPQPAEAIAALLLAGGNPAGSGALALARDA